MTKSRLTRTNVVDGTMSSIIDAIGCAKLALLITYLGILLGGNPRYKAFGD